jgi:bleomycin hydrolase
MASITTSNLAQWRKAYASSAKNLLATNAVCHNDVVDVLTSRSAAVESAINEFSTRMKYDEAKITNQKSTGRCWLFGTF